MSSDIYVSDENVSNEEESIDVTLNVSQETSSLSRKTQTEQEQMTESTSKPPYTYMDLIKMAFANSTLPIMTTHEITKLIEIKIPSLKKYKSKLYDNVLKTSSQNDVFVNIHHMMIVRPKMNNEYWVTTSYDFTDSSILTYVPKEPKQRNMDEKPPFSCVALIQMAFLSTQEETMSTVEIRDFFERRFPYFEKYAKNYYSTIYRTLNSNICFIRTCKDINVYWILDMDFCMVEDVMFDIVNLPSHLKKKMSLHPMEVQHNLNQLTLQRQTYQLLMQIT